MCTDAPLRSEKIPIFLGKGASVHRLTFLDWLKLQRIANEYAVKCRIYESKDLTSQNIHWVDTPNQVDSVIQCVYGWLLFTLYERHERFHARSDVKKLAWHPLTHLNFKWKLKTIFMGGKIRRFASLMRNAEKWYGSIFNLFILSLSVDREKQESITDSWQKIKNENRLLLMYIWTPQLLN